MHEWNIAQHQLHDKDNLLNKRNTGIAPASLLMTGTFYQQIR
jgi:hypothetical protein